MPGVYEELDSRGPAPAGCEDVYQRTEAGQFALTYDEHRQCPNAQNLIAILGDTNGDRICDAKCNIQIEGTGSRPDDVQIAGERAKLNVIRADRADGVVLRNFKVDAVRLQQHLRARDERLPDRPRRVRLQPRVRNPVVHLGPRHLRELRDLRERRLGRLPGLGSRPSRHPGRARSRVRDRDPQLQLARQQHRVVRDGGERHAVPQQPVPRQRDRGHDGLVRGRAPGPAPGCLEVDRQPDLLEQQEHLQRRPRRLLQAARRRTATRRSCVPRSRCRSAPGS